MIENLHMALLCQHEYLPNLYDVDCQDKHQNYREKSRYLEIYHHLGQISMYLSMPHCL